MVDHIQYSEECRDFTRWKAIRLKILTKIMVGEETDNVREL